MAYQTHHCSVTFLALSASVSSAHITCTFCSSPFYALCAISHSMQHSSSVQFSCCTLPPCSHLNHLPQQQQQLQQQQQHHLFSVPCIYSFCAPRACNVRNSSACSHHADILHLSSALPDHHGNSSASLAVFPRVQHHWVLC
jgi:hypothetical protein